jgi:hypothetical protein
MRRRAARLRLELDVADPDRNRRLRHAEHCRDVEERASFGAHLACLFLRFDLAAIPHDGSVRRG